LSRVPGVTRVAESRAQGALSSANEIDSERARVRRIFSDDRQCGWVR